MDVNTVTQLIGSLGFPIVVCGVMFYVYRENLNSVKESLDENTKIINEMKTMIQTFMDYMAKMTVKDGE